MFTAAAVAAGTVLYLLPPVANASRQATTSAPGTPVGFTEVGSVAFSTSSKGFALVFTSTGTYVARTGDQGRHWLLASPTALYQRGTPASGAVTAIGTRPGGTVFAYPGGGAGSVIDVSNDSGREWTTAHFPGTVADVVANGPTLWALVNGPARNGPPFPPPPPRGWLYASMDGGRTWARRSTLPASVGPYQVMSAPTHSVGYALAPGEHNRYDGRYGGLAETTDSGRTWRTVGDFPCDENASPRFGQDAELGGVGRNDVWLACGIPIPPSPGNVDLVLRSDDRGRHWSLVASSTIWFLAHDVKPNFPATAMVAPAGDPGTSLFGVGGAWLVLASPSLLVRSTDGGRSWADGAPGAIESQGPQQVLDAGGTVVVRTRSALWRLGTRGWQEVNAARPVDRGAPLAASRLALASSSSSPSSAARTALASPLEPTWIALVNGDLYIADGGRQEILKRSPDGTFSVVAGTGAPGFSGDGGPATDAKIDNPSYLVALGSRSLFFQQAGLGQGSLIREITPSGVIRTVAGLHPSCAGVAASATSMAAESAPLNGVALAAGADGSVLLEGAQPCPQAGRLGPFLQLTPTGQLADTQLDLSPLINSALVDCGPSANGRGFTVFVCFSGAGHPKELLVLRDNGTTETYPAFRLGPITSANGEVVAARNDGVVRVESHGLETIASSQTLDGLVSGTSILDVGALALSNDHNIFLTTDQVNRKGCTATISEISSSGRVQRLWRSPLSRLCY